MKLWKSPGAESCSSRLTAHSHPHPQNSADTTSTPSPTNAKPQPESPLSVQPPPLVNPCSPPRESHCDSHDPCFIPPRASSVPLPRCRVRLPPYSPPGPCCRHSPPLTLYAIATNSRAAPKDTRPLVLSGPSGVGKGTLYGLLFERHPDAFALSVSHTTRAPRAGESNGVHYHFVQMQDFEDLIDDEGFVEHAKFGGNRYGTSKKTIEEQTAKGRVVLLDIEMEVRCPHFQAPFPPTSIPPLYIHAAQAVGS